MRLRQLLFAGLLIPFFGCTDPEPGRTEKPHAYFDVPGFVAQQVKTLENSEQTLQKTVGFGHEKPETHTVNQPNWNEELTLFQEIDLNKKALEGLYTETLTQTPEGEKLIYNRTPEADAPFALIEIARNQQQQVTALRAVYEQENGLFFSREERTLQAGPTGGLRGYKIKGVQKVLLFDSLNYTISSKLP